MTFNPISSPRLSAHNPQPSTYAVEPSCFGNSGHETVSRAYRQRFAVDWLRLFGFNNTYAITVRKKTDASSHNLRTISDLIAVSGTIDSIYN